MFVKYQHVRNGGIVAVLGGAVAAIVIGTASKPDPGPEITPPPDEVEAPRPLVATDLATTSVGEIMALAETSSGGQAKRKDALGAATAWKVNLYDDDQDGRWDRAKLDRDRDDTWDEAWSRDELARWKRDGDGATWRNGAWRGGEAAPAEPTERPTVDEAAVIALASKPSGGKAKIKDALGAGSPWKVNLYDDDQDGTFDRLKLDRGRDDTWDEAWSHKSGQWQQDDSGELWRDGAWVAPAAPTPATAAKGPALRVVEAMAGRASGKKVKDLYRGSGPKVNIYDDDGDGRWDRAKVDLDRDDTWDEKLTRKGDGFERKVEASGEVFVLKGGAWVAK